MGSPKNRPVRGGFLLSVVLLVASPICGCSIKRIAINKVADALAAGGEVYASDEDPDLVRDAVPFALKTMESLLAEAPEHRGLLVSACSGFTQYAYAFVQTDADLLEDADYSGARDLRERALKLYLRARDYGLRALETRRPGIAARLVLQPETAVADLGEPDVEAIYWTAAAWGAAISLAKDRPEIVADLPVVVSLMRRALELDESYGSGALHEVMIALESLPANMGGSIDRARGHFKRALVLSGGLRAGPYVALAENVSVAEQDRQEFERLLESALAVDADADPAARLQNLIVKKRARWLLGRVEELFFEAGPSDP